MTKAWLTPHRGPTPEDIRRLHERFSQVAAEVVCPAADVACDVLGITDRAAKEWVLGLMWATFGDGYAYGGLEVMAQGIEAGVDVRVSLYDPDDGLSVGPNDGADEGDAPGELATE